MKLTKEWIGGFISGEGCFTFFIQKQTNYFYKKVTNPVSIYPSFALNLHIRDITTLISIKKELKCGSVNSYTKSNSCCLHVGGIKNCNTVITFLEGHLHGEKLDDFLIWKEGISKLEEINKTKKFKRPKYTKEEVKYFENIRPRTRKS